MIVGTGVLLLTAAVGYWVILQAEGHKRGLRRLGRWLGGGIIAAAILETACLLTCGAAGKTCPLAGAGKAAWCPLAGSRAAPPSALP